MRPAKPGQRDRRTVFRDIGVYAWMRLSRLGQSRRPSTIRSISAAASMQAGSDLLVDRDADFTKLPLKEMLNLHVHWGTPQAGEDDVRYDNDRGHKNSVRL